jgi:uracil-DNA glycosylase
VTAGAGGPDPREAGARLARILRERLLLERSFGLDPASEWERPAIAARPAAPLRAPAASRQPPAADRPPEAADPERSRRLALLDPIRAEVRACRACALCERRTQTVFGVGDPCAALVFVGEGPGEEEDRQGEPFVGPAGQLLTRMIAAMGLSRETVYIANVVKCRPPGNRKPEPGEMAACLPYLLRQLDLIAPRAICALGNMAAKALLDTPESITRLRGKFAEHRGIPVLPTFHPSYLLRTPDDKRLAWSDLRKIMEFLGLPDPRDRRDGGAGAG